MRGKIYKNLALVFLAITQLVFVFRPQPATAQFDVVFIGGGQSETFEINPALVGSAVQTAGAAVGSLSQITLEWAQTFVLSALKKRILDMLVDQIIGWVQGDGDPKFITDWGAFLADVGNEVAGDFVKELGYGFLCSPFSAQIRLSLQSPRRFSERASCTLDQIVGNIQSFYNNFSNGGWLAYSESWQPQNNYYGSFLTAQKELDERTERAGIAAQNEGIAGGGFLSSKDASGNITTPGSVIGSLVGKAVGSDIDLIVNAEQLQDYVGNIANAVFNRLIKEGVGGLAGLSTPSKPKTASGAISAGAAGPCAGLSGATLQSCLNYVSASGNSFTTAQSNIISQINQTLLPMLDARNLINSSIDTLQKYADDLNKIYIDLFVKQKKLSFESECQKSANELQQEILDEIDKAELAIDRLRQNQNNNQTIIASLELTKNQIETLPQNDWVGLTAAIEEVRNKTNALEAENVKSAAKTENDNTKTATADKLASFKKQVNLCYQ